MIHRLSKFIFHTLLGWKLVGDLPGNLKKYVLIAAPHTSWKDFPIAILARTVVRIQINYVGKASLFKPPFGFIYRRLGGTPVNRSRSTNLVDVIVALFNEKEEFRLGLSPEGTRQFVNRWKTGFYYIAKSANVPVVMVALDFKNKQIKIANPYYLTAHMEEDFNHFLEFYKKIVPAKPELFNNKNLL